MIGVRGTKRGPVLAVGLLLVLLLIVSICMPGCATKSEPQQERPAAEQPKEQASSGQPQQDESLKEVSLVLATVGPGTGFYNLSVAVSATIEKYTPMLITPQVVPGVFAIQEKLVSKEADLGPSASIDMYLAYTGDPAYAGKDYSDIRCLMAGYNNYISFVVANGSNINSVTDLKGKRVVYETTGSIATTLIARGLFEYYGLDPQKDIKQVKAVHVTDAYKEVAEGRADAAIFAYVQGTVEEYAHKFTPRFLPIEQKAYEYLVSKYPGLLLQEFPAELDVGGALKGTPVVGFVMGLWARKDMDNKIAYTIVKTLVETYDKELAQRDFNTRQFSPKRAVQCMGVPYHDGAIQYYKEAGLWSEEMDKYQASILR